MSAPGKVQTSMQQNNIAETVIGAIVVAVAVIFLAFAYFRTGSGSLSGYEVNAKLPKADGLGIGTDVRLDIHPPPSAQSEGPGTGAGRA